MRARVSFFLSLTCTTCDRPTSESLFDDATCVIYATRWGEYFMGGDGGIIALDRHGNISLTFNITA
jgi:hypothetical protein